MNQSVKGHAKRVLQKGRVRCVDSTNWGKHDPLLEHLPTDKKSYPQVGVTKVDVDKVIKSVPEILDEIFGRKGDQ